MDHQDHLNLIRDGVPSPGGAWAEFGSGRGAFTLALAELLGPAGMIYSVDRDPAALRDQEQTLRARLGDKLPSLHFLAADYTRPLDLRALDGVLMANALHFQRQKEAVLARIQSYLHPGGCLILVEYNVDSGNPWVPYPLSYPAWRVLAGRAGFTGARLLATRPSRILGEIFSAVSFKPLEAGEEILRNP
jgi:SAM-dependent methyltransferase